MRLSVFFKILKRNKKAFLGFWILVGFVLMATVGRLLVPLPAEPNYANRFLPPSLAHPLGTDYAGRDTLALIIHGSTDVLLISLFTAFFAVALAIVLGMSAGLLGGAVDLIIMRLVDIFLTIPSFPVMAILAALFKIRDPITFSLILGLWSWPPLASSIRTQVMSLKNKEFIQICTLMGLPLTHIIFNELLPNLVPYIAVNFINIAKNAITASVGIMLLGLVPLSVSNWGMMLNLATISTGAIYVPQAYGYLFAPIFFIVLLQLGMIFFASGLEEIFDPRLRA